MLTWSAARTKVRGDLWRPGTTGVPDDVCDRALHASLLEVEQARRFLWLENISRTVALVAASATFLLPVDYRSIASVSLVRTDGKIDAPLERINVAQAKMSAAAVLSAGLPTAYGLNGTTVYLDAKADVGQLFELVGITRTPDDLDAAVAGYATNVTLQLHQALVIAGACAEVAATYLRNDRVFALQRATFQRRLDRLIDAEDEARSDTTGGRVQPDTAYQEMAGG